jgi:uncharacterized protein (DUF58 family)
MRPRRKDKIPASGDDAAVEDAAALLRAALESVDSAEVPVGSLPREVATRRRVEGAVAGLDALAGIDASSAHETGAPGPKNPG